MESYCFINLSVVNEMKLFNFNSVANIFSLIFNFIFWAWMCLFLVLWVIIWKYSTSPSFIRKQWWYKELFEGLKDNKMSRLFSITFMFTRLLSASIIISFARDFYILKLLWFGFVNSCQVGYTLIVKPFSDARENIIETINQISYIFLVGGLLFLQEQKDWTDAYEGIYLTLFIAPSVIAVVISIFALVMNLW